MEPLSKSAIQLLHHRSADNALRQLSNPRNLIDFSSNDYLGFAKSAELFNAAHQILIDCNCIANGATGSRLLTGNHALYKECESVIADFHQCESALLFNSGYDANVGFFSSVPQRGDTILYDELCHASIRDGIRLGTAKAYKFAHNDLEALEELILRHQSVSDEIYIATESVFSMDGDSPDLTRFVELAEKYNCFTVVDEAHALGVFGNNGHGMLQQLNIHNRVFARIVTYGKGLGCHGAAILGSDELRNYLINFARSFIYSTGLPPHSVATVLAAYKMLGTSARETELLRDNISYFNSEKTQLGLKPIFVRSKSAIQSAIIPGNDNVKKIALKCTENGFDIRPILSPTVPGGQERLRICLHSYNTPDEIRRVLQLLATSFG